MPNGTLTPQEQKVLKQLEETCRKHGPRLNLPMQQTCALLKRQRDLESELKRVEMEAKARSALEDNKHKATAYVSRRVHALQTEGLLLVAALIRASNVYDAILAARASKPIFGEIIFTLALTALPELRVAGRAVKAFVPTKSSFRKLLTDVPQQSSWETLTEHVASVVQKQDDKAAQVMKRVSRFADSLDAQAKDAIEAIKDPLAARADIDGETEKRMHAFGAKNQVLTRLIREIQRTLVASLFAELICHKFIFWYDGKDVFDLTQSIFKSADLDEYTTYKGEGFDLFADLILYDMLRAYVKNYFIVKFEVTYGKRRPTVDQAPSSFPEHWIKGLDGAQRQLIYDRFGKVPWNDLTRPPVSNYKDLVRHWSGKFVTVDVEPMRITR